MKAGDPAKRFWSKVDTSAGPDACWVWRASRRSDGYGKIQVGGRQGRSVAAHRFAFELANGPIPPSPGYHGTCVCHRCDNPVCCNPAHLFLGTPKDNSADMWRKGRARMPPVSTRARGERHGNCHFSDETVREAVSLVEQGWRQSDVCRRLGMSPAYLCQLMSGARQRAERKAA